MTLNGVMAVTLRYFTEVCKYAKKCTDFSSVSDMVTIFTYIIGFSRLENSNMLSEFFRVQRSLLWQPNLGKNKPKLHKFQFCTKY